MLHETPVFGQELCREKQTQGVGEAEFERDTEGKEESLINVSMYVHVPHCHFSM